MFLSKLRLTNFRNYSNLDFEFKTPITILLGDNAQGKTNFLESIYYLSTTKSPKADRDEELITEDQTFNRVEGLVTTNQETNELEISMQLISDTLSKKVKLNGIPKRIIDYIGNLPIVFFAPEDINLVTDSPSLRRWHIDMTLAQVDKEYKKALTSYEEIVKRKNRILKNIRENLSQKDELDYWREQQVFYGRVVSNKRKEFFEFLNSIEKQFGQFNYQYIQNELSLERLQAYQEREIASASSLIGPHRDDFKFLEIKETPKTRDLAKFGSRGEQRTAVLDLKISESFYIEKVLGTRPILLLDDIFSELDHLHKQHVLDLIALQQTVLAAVDLDKPLLDQISNATIVYVNQGTTSLV